MRKIIKGAAITAVAGLVLTTAGHAAELNCLSWKSAASVIVTKSLVPADAIYQLVRQRTGGQVIQVSFCENNGQALYKVVVIGSQGDVSNVTIDAVTGQPENDRNSAFK